MIRRVLVAIVCSAACAALSVSPSETESRVTLLVVPNSTVLRVLARSQLDFVADLFWVRMANMASRAVTAKECGALLPLGNLIADLSPQFKYPYFLAGVIAPVRRGRTRDYDNAVGAVALMKRGVEDAPWGRLYLQKAFTELEMLHEPITAANTLMRFASEPDAPTYIGPLATRLYAHGGHFDDAREFARTMAQSEDPTIKADGEARLKQIDLEEVLTRVDDATARFTEQEGHLPESIEALVKSGLLAEMPVDPLGGQILITSNGSRSSTSGMRFRPYIPLGSE